MHCRNIFSMSLPSVFLLLGSVGFGQNVPSDKVAQEQDIREAVLRKEMGDWIRDAEKGEKEAKNPNEKGVAAMLNFDVFFISIDGKDPSNEFMRRFSDVPRVMKKVSQSKIRKNVIAPVVDKKTGQRGIIFSADEIDWLDKDTVEVGGGYQCAGLCSSGVRYGLKRENGKWIVKGAKTLFMS